ncbi:AAA family ATPase [Corynebacterium jeddahense]|uniref:Recombination protein F n=1 Tax=Corynebacterium jeddahense TaxID=1414719 RepID=A0ABY7UNH2_9CORY|nr:AAA family ATPase [Corynebacterium jeddahense]WCZ39706.1 recombination protein F [Corynebacterium jeddahense]
MQIRSLRMANFRRFDHLEVDFDPKLTVIAARNGKGKTTVLEATALALGPFVGAFDESRGENIKPSDARFTGVEREGDNEQAFPVVIDAVFNNPVLRSTRELRGAKRSTTTGGSRNFADYGKTLQDAVREYQPVVLPAVCYYSSKRLWVHHNRSSLKAESKSRTAGYTDCLSAMSSFNQLTEWVKKAELVDLQQQQRFEGVPVDSSRLRGVSETVSYMLQDEGWSDFHYDFGADALVLRHADHGKLPVNMLSDGIRAMTTLAADLARRACQLNPSLGASAPQQTPGVVLVDEVDLHLHPEWQQRVLGGLTRAFPAIQFIVSTHSPQVLSSVSHQNIRTIYQDADGHWQAEEPREEIVGLSSEVALSQVMRVNPKPPVDEKDMLNEYTNLIEQGLSRSAQALDLRTSLENTYGDGHQVLRDADRLIRFQDLKLRRAGQEQKSR